MTDTLPILEDSDLENLTRFLDTLIYIDLANQEDSI